MKLKIRNITKMAELQALRLKMDKVYFSTKEIHNTLSPLGTKELWEAIEKYGYYGGYIEDKFQYTKCDVCLGPRLMHKEASSENCQKGETEKVQFTDEELKESWC